MKNNYYIKFNSGELTEDNNIELNINQNIFELLNEIEHDFFYKYDKTIYLKENYKFHDIKIKSLSITNNKLNLKVDFINEETLKKDFNKGLLFINCKSNIFFYNKSVIDLDSILDRKIIDVIDVDNNSFKERTSLNQAISLKKKENLNICLSIDSILKEENLLLSLDSDNINLDKSLELDKEEASYVFLSTIETPFSFKLWCKVPNFIKNLSVSPNYEFLNIINPILDKHYYDCMWYRESEKENLEYTRGIKDKSRIDRRKFYGEDKSKIDRRKFYGEDRDRLDYLRTFLDLFRGYFTNDDELKFIEDTMIKEIRKIKKKYKKNQYEYAKYKDESVLEFCNFANGKFCFGTNWFYLFKINIDSNQNKNFDNDYKLFKKKKIRKGKININYLSAHKDNVYIKNINDMPTTKYNDMPTTKKNRKITLFNFDHTYRVKREFKNNIPNLFKENIPIKFENNSDVDLQKLYFFTRIYRLMKDYKHFHKYYNKERHTNIINDNLLVNKIFKSLKIDGLKEWFNNSKEWLNNFNKKNPTIFLIYNNKEEILCIDPYYLENILKIIFKLGPKFGEEFWKAYFRINKDNSLPLVISKKDNDNLFLVTQLKYDFKPVLFYDLDNNNIYFKNKSYEITTQMGYDPRYK
jgi:hypothetical protein